MSDQMERGLARVRAGELDFGKFVQETRADWRRLAEYLHRRWPLPSWVSIEDVEQDMLLGAFEFLSKYDQTRGDSIASYVIYNATDKAKKRMHKARGANLHRRSDFSKSVIPKLESTMTRAGAESPDTSWLDQHAVEPDQDRLVMLNEQVRHAKRKAVGRVERCSVEHVCREGSMEGGAETMYANPDVRIACRLGNKQQALSAVRKSMKNIAARMGVAA